MPGQTQSILTLVLIALSAALAAVLLSSTNSVLTSSPTTNSSPAMSTTMRAVIHNPQGSTADELRIGVVDRPQVKADHVLIRVKAFGLNRADVVQREGKYPPPAGASLVMGLECAGEVVEVGPSSSSSLPHFSVGDRVMSLLPGGGYAEYALAHLGSTIRIPDALSYEEGAAFVEVFTTSYQLMRYICKVQAGETVLVHAGASGIGSAAIQLAHLFGAKAIVTAGTEEKLNYCRELGADAAYSYKTGNWSDEVRSVLKSWGKDGVDVILDPVGRSHANANANLLAMDARWIMFAMLSGSVVDGFDLSLIYKKRALLTGSQLRARPAEYKTALIGEMVREVYPALQDGRVKVTIDTVYPWDRITEAHQHLEEDKTKGKVICTVK